MKFGKTLVSVLLIALLVVLIPNVSAEKITPLVIEKEFLVSKKATDSLQLDTLSGHQIDIQFIALNPGGQPMPISSVNNFKTNIMETQYGYKWDYELRLPNTKFKAVAKITSPVAMTLSDNHVHVDGLVISFDDVLDYDYSFVVNQIDAYTIEYEISKDYDSKGIKVNDLIVIDPLVTIPSDASDGHIRYQNGVFHAVNTGADFMIAGTYFTGGFDNWYRSYLEFDTTNQTDINRATFYIYYEDRIWDNVTDCDVIVESIPPFAPLDSSDWNIAGNVTVTSSLININDSRGVWYSVDVTDYINESGNTSFRFKGSVESTSSEDCRFEMPTSMNASFYPYLEIITAEPSELFNVSSSLSNQIYAQQSCGFLLPFTEPYDPKVSCETDGDSCVAVFYENQPFCGRGIKYALSRDGFETIEYIGNIDTTAFSQTVFIDEYYTTGHELPYDIIYFDFNSNYYFVRGTKVYVMPVFDPGVFGVTPYRFTDGYTIASGETIGADISMDCCVEVNHQCAGFPCNCASASRQNIQTIKFYDGNATKLFGTFQGQPQRTTPSTDWDGWFGWFTYDVTNTTTTVNGNLYDCTELWNTPSCSAGGNFAVDEYSGYAEFDGSTTWYYVIEGVFDFCTGTINQALAFDNFGSPQKYYNQVWFGGNLYYRNTTNREMISSESSDLVSFASPDIQYFETISIDETINQSDAGSGGFSNLYVWSRDSTLTDGTNGIWAQAQTTYPVIVSSNEDVFATLTCSSESYTTTESGKIFQIFTPCLTGNQITFVSSKTPGSDVKTFDVGTCSSVSFNINYADSPYDFVFTVKDALTNTNIAGADISLTGETDQTTDSNGQAIFNIQPITDSELKDETSSSGCIHTLSTDGTPTTLYGEVSKTGYVDTVFSLTPASKTESDSNVWTFDDNEIVTLYPEGVVLNVRAYTIDGQEIVTSSYNASVTGNNNLTYTFVNGKPSLRNFNRNLPSEFLLYDNRTTYNITVTLDYIVGTESRIVEVTVNEQYPVYFYLPFTFLDLPCSTAQDCVKDFCDEIGFHNRLSGCTDNTCQFETTDCQSPALCDPTVGCYQLNTEVPCTGDNTCLFNNNVTYCIDDVTMYAGFCGSDGFCKAKEKTCATFCNTTLNYCNERADCLLENPIDVGYEYPGGGTIAHADCNFNNAGQSFCLQFGDIPIAQLNQEGLTIQDVRFTHSDFIAKYVTTPEPGYAIGDVVATCTDTCEVELEFCSSGSCSTETNQCLKSASSSVFKGMASGGWEWLQGVVPLELRLMAWLLFTILMMIVYKQATGQHGSDNDRTTLVVGAVIFFIGIGIGWVHWIFLLIIGTIISIIMWKQVA